MPLIFKPGTQFVRAAVASPALFCPYMAPYEFCRNPLESGKVLLETLPDPLRDWRGFQAEGVGTQ